MKRRVRPYKDYVREAFGFDPPWWVPVVGGASLLVLVVALWVLR